MMTLTKRRVTSVNKNFDVILYDLDGTLINSVPVIIDSFVKTYEEVFGECTRSIEDIKSYIGKPLMASFESHDEATAKVLFDKYLQINCQMLEQDKVDLFPGVMDSLKYLKSLGYKQGIVTSKRESSAIITLKHKGMDTLFDTYVYSEDTKEHKPAPDPIIEGARRVGVTDMSRVLYVGDAIPDAACATNAGAGFALVSWSDMNPDKIIKKYRGTLINSLKDIVQI